MSKRIAKKRIAVFANGWNGANIKGFIDGLKKSLPENYADFFMFISYASYGIPDDWIKAEHKIYDLPDLKTFDGAIIYGPGLNFAEIIDHICERCIEADIPVVTVGIERDNFSCIKVDNYNGMKTLVDHLIEEHGVKHISVMAGSAENDDSNVRIKATRDSLEAHGLKLDDEDIFYTNWETDQAAIRAGELYDLPKDKRPDALVAANDYLAIFSLIAIERKGGSIPKDIIISGFDAVEDSSVFYPSLASVDQNQVGIGECAAKLLMDRLNGGEPETLVRPCTVYPGESCGCQECRNEEHGRHLLGRGKPEKKIRDHFKAACLRKIEASITASDRYENLVPTVQSEFYGKVGYEGDIFYLMLDPNITGIAKKEYREMPALRFASNMDVIVGRDVNNETHISTVDNREILPEYYKLKERRLNSFYVIVPVYLDTYVCGYVTLGYNSEFFAEDFYQEARERLISSLRTYKKNLQLAALYDQLSDLMQEDPLTHVRNRHAYEKYKEGLEKEMAEHKDCEFAIILFDINNLKQINDSMGHEAGDEYIKNCSQHICKVFKHSPVFRIGGDEFVAVLKNDDYLNRSVLVDHFRDVMESLASEDIPVVQRVSIASGMAVLVGNTPEALIETFRIADERMYMNKTQMKKQLFIKYNNL